LESPETQITAIVIEMRTDGIMNYFDEHNKSINSLRSS
jgi:hypothetical protein